MPSSTVLYIVKPPNKICIQCGIAFRVNPAIVATTKYCSIACRRKGLGARRNAWRCSNCGRHADTPELRSNSYTATHCSRECQMAVIDKKIAAFRCLRCGGPIRNITKGIRYGIDKRIYCSPKCAKCAPEQPTLVRGNCQICGQFFWRRWSVSGLGKQKDRGKYCSIPCRTIAMRMYPKGTTSARGILTRHTTLKRSEVPDELVEIQMLHTQLKREAREAHNA